MDKADVLFSHLLGLPPAHEYLQFMEYRVPEATFAERSNWSREWRDAADRWRVLEAEESPNVNNPVLTELPHEMFEISQNVLREPSVKCALEPLPYRWSMVDSDNLIPRQQVIDLSFVETLKSRLEKKPNPKALFEFSAGCAQDPPPVRVTRLSEYVYTFSSPSTDLRLLRVGLLDLPSLLGLQVPGHASHGIGVTIGFGLNFISAIHYQSRLILMNGTHHACTYHECGIERFPCLVRTVAREGDLALIGTPEDCQSCEFLARTSRPPLLRDFFDPRLTKLLRANREDRLIHVQIRAERSRVAT